ncbi:MmcQ/YjbR family DNA-binding protein [Bacillus solimangrovi]|uniref:MmcQ-like protein n=1 Tax=Bacillus solimangrovi TaxID=1305675 RepID=A0A1E5LAH3_9BACI|nr:MmcQ/YjbR family DNA-binding protein [Bacillus solimangrovi]OEH91060.1 MmcQ-like protein [Bacillus solimangrovi]
MDFNVLRENCLNKRGAYEDFPFGEDAHVMKVGSKMFAILSIKENLPAISLKCEPDVNEILREQYPAIKPGYHLNKRHWNTITVDGTVPYEQILQMINRSYDLVFNNLKKIDREEIYNKNE